MTKIVAAAALLLATFMPATSQVAFRGFGFPASVITSMSADGSVIVGYTLGLPVTDGFRWTQAGGLERIGGAGAYGISRDGKTIVGSVRDEKLQEIAAIWISGRSWQQLGGVPGGKPDLLTGILSTAYDVSGDGSVIVGLAYDQNFRPVGFRWQQSTGMVNLGPFGKGFQQSALAVSANGNVVVGRDNDQDNHALAGYRGYVYYGGEFHLLHPYGWAGEARATNDVGSIIVGQGPPVNTYNVIGGLTAYMYTAWDGRFQDLGAVWPGQPGINLEEYQSRALSVNDTGTVVVGETGGANTTYAMIWTPDTGMLYMHDYLTKKGVTTHGGWYLKSAYYVSPDGKTIAGPGTNPQGIPDSWIVTLP